MRKIDDITFIKIIIVIIAFSMCMFAWVIVDHIDLVHNEVVECKNN
ncbi:MAG: hypothetical protein IKL65_05580 [Bacilli bacterium]|nr:hypothetical protein [Bacilli bacterium]MBR6690784.1 hypothetical protein [Bacilli bacterium]